MLNLVHDKNYSAFSYTPLTSLSNLWSNEMLKVSLSTTVNGLCVRVSLRVKDNFFYTQWIQNFQEELESHRETTCYGTSLDLFLFEFWRIISPLFSRKISQNTTFSDIFRENSGELIRLNTVKF